MTTGKFRQFSDENVQLYVYNNLYYLKSEINVFILFRIYENVLTILTSKNSVLEKFTELKRVKRCQNRH